MVIGDHAVARKPEEEGATGNRRDRRRRGEDHALPDLRDGGAVRGSGSRTARRCGFSRPHHRRPAAPPRRTPDRIGSGSWPPSPAHRKIRQAYPFTAPIAGRPHRQVLRRVAGRVGGAQRRARSPPHPGRIVCVRTHGISRRAPAPSPGPGCPDGPGEDGPAARARVAVGRGPGRVRLHRRRAAAARDRLADHRAPGAVGGAKAGRPRKTCGLPASLSAGSSPGHPQDSGPLHHRRAPHRRRRSWRTGPKRHRDTGRPTTRTDADPECSGTTRHHHPARRHPHRGPPPPPGRPVPRRRGVNRRGTESPHVRGDRA